MPRKIENVIFDLGNVLLDFKWLPFIYGLWEKDVADRVTRVLWEKDRWNRMDEGTLSIPDACELAAAEEPELREQIFTSMDKLGDCFSKFDYAVPWVQELKALGFSVYYLSNYSDYMRKIRPDVLESIIYMDGGVFSCDVKMTKPNKKIYEFICAKYRLNPAECLFIDDLERNIEGARAFGMNAFHFENFEKSYPEIMKMLRE